MSSFCILQATVIFSPLYQIHRTHGFWNVVCLDKRLLLYIFAFIQFHLRQFFYKVTSWIKIYRINPENIRYLEIRHLVLFSSSIINQMIILYVCEHQELGLWLIKVRLFNLSKFWGRRGSHEAQLSLTYMHNSRKVKILLDLASTEKESIRSNIDP